MQTLINPRKNLSLSCQKGKKKRKTRGNVKNLENTRNLKKRQKNDKKKLFYVNQLKSTVKIGVKTLVK
mgnify:CR=1 FL=1